MLKLFDSHSRHLVDFQPADGKTALVYSCGPTVYDFAHIGNFRAFIFGDILCRWLPYLGPVSYTHLTLPPNTPL